MKKGRRLKSKGATQSKLQKPFFARYLEGQDEQEARATAEISSHRGQAQARTRSTTVKTTMKYPSDNDELVFYPYYTEEIAGNTANIASTNKYPSDGDDDSPLYAFYLDAQDVPKSRKVKPKDARVALTNKPAHKNKR
jgi:hypothetical protein